MNYIALKDRKGRFVIILAEARNGATGARPAVQEISVCHVIKDGNMLFIKYDEGINKGKWNAPNGEIVHGETPAKSAARHVFQQTGLYIDKLTNHGTVKIYLNGKNNLSYKLHIFSTRSFNGDVKPTVKGEVKWFNGANIPFYDMWPGDKYWINMVMQDKKFEGDFFLDEKNENISKYKLNEKESLLGIGKYLPAIIAIVVIAAVIFGVARSGVLSHLTLPKAPTILAPSNTHNTIKGSTTITATTTIPFVPRITIDNVNLKYNYSGPDMENGYACNYQTHMNIVPYKRYVNTTEFMMNITWSSGACNLTIYNMVSTTKGFRVVSTTPSLPVYLPPYSQVYVEYIMGVNSGAGGNYIGPLSLTVYDN